VHFNLNVRDGGTVSAATKRGGPQARAALVVCPGFQSYPFKAGAIPGFFGYMYGRGTLECPRRAEAVYKSITLRLKRTLSSSCIGSVRRL